MINSKKLIRTILFIITLGLISPFPAAQQTEKTARPNLTSQQERTGSENTSQPRASNQAKMRGDYVERIRAKIKRFIVLPPNLHGNPEVEFLIKLLPDGNVVGMTLKRSSGNTEFDNAVERAIGRAQPLPLPPDPAMAKDFQDIVLKFEHRTRE